MGNSSGVMPSASGFLITPDDNNDLPVPIRGIYIGSSGNLKVLLQDDTNAVTFVGLIVGILLSIQVKRVYSTGTTAGSLIGLS